jgi:crotonobetainyl-CoA:carnitine CoA-transferase CaiB-like acyl-CoA transferase
VTAGLGRVSQVRVPPAPAGAAVALARGHLAALGLARAAADVRLSVDWAGPIDLPLADEALVQAACGIMHVHGRARGGPEPLAVDYATTVAGVLAAQGVLAALLARARGLRLDEVRTSVGQAALVSVVQYLAAATCGEDEPAAAPGSPSFVSADGVRFEVETLEAEAWQRFWQGLGADEGALRRAWPVFARRFATATCPVPPTLAEATRRRDFATLAAEGVRSGVSVVAVTEAPDPLGPPWAFAPLPPSARPTGTPTRLPLDGLVVVESTRRVQGPLAGHVLRLLGAEVLRIEPPGGDPARGEPPYSGGLSARYAALNAGKRVVEADLRDRDTVRDLVSRADVFLHNWAPGRAARRGLDADDLARVRPGLVYAWASGWGDRLGRRPPVGTDYPVQARSGLAAALRPAGEAAAPSLMTLTDVLGGLVSAEGVLAGLLDRVRFGRGARVDTSLLSAAGVVPRRERPVWTELDRPVPTGGGFVALARPARRPREVAAVLGDGGDPPGEVAARLCAAGLPAAAVCTDLRDLAADTRFARAVRVDGFATPGAPWGFA